MTYKMKVKEKRHSRFPFSVIVLSLLVAFFCDIKCINRILVNGGYAGEGTMNILYPAIIISILVFSFIYNNWKMPKVSLYSISLVAILLVYYIITMMFIGKPYTPLLLFSGLTLFSFLLPSLTTVDARLMLKAMMLFPIIGLPRIEMVFATVAEWQDFTSMEVSYGFLIPVTASIVYLFVYFRDETFKQKLVTIALFIANAVFFVYLLRFASRGVIVSLALLILFYFITDMKDNCGIRWKKGRVGIVFIVFIILAFSFIAFFEYMNKWASNTFGVDFYVLEKMVDMADSGDISNGREGLNVITWKGFWESPLWGNGIDIYDSKTQMAYPHNFILNILYDGGLLLFLFILVPITKGFVKKLKSCNKDEYALFMVLFFSSVPGALFSQDMYQVSVLWITFGYAVSKTFVYKNLVRN